jgi:hypothetical protein
VRTGRTMAGSSPLYDCRPTTPERPRSRAVPMALDHVRGRSTGHLPPTRRCINIRVEPGGDRDCRAGQRRQKEHR